MVCQRVAAAAMVRSYRQAAGRHAVLPGRRLCRARADRVFLYGAYGDSKLTCSASVDGETALVRQGWSARALDARSATPCSTVSTSLTTATRRQRCAPATDRRLDDDLWGLGVVQEIDAAAMSVWLSYRHIEGDTTIALARLELRRLPVREGRRAHQLLSLRHSLARSEAARVNRAAFFFSGHRAAFAPTLCEPSRLRQLAASATSVTRPREPTLPGRMTRARRSSALRLWRCGAQQAAVRAEQASPDADDGRGHSGAVVARPASAISCVAERRRH